MDPLINSQLLYQLSYAANRALIVPRHALAKRETRVPAQPITGTQVGRLL